jgi:predicted transcriptional regulator
LRLYTRASTNDQNGRIDILTDAPRNSPVPTSDAEAFNASELTSDIVAAYVANNSLRIADLPALIQSVHAALAQLANGPVNSAPQAETQEPGVSIRKSITPDYLVCLDDGKKFKSLRRHLGALGLTPEQYRSKWNLPLDYPMVAPNYSAARSEMAKRIGLGQMSKTAAPRQKASTVVPAKRGRQGCSTLFTEGH